MLIISYYFPPCTDGASTLMYNLCKYLPKEVYTVITSREELGVYCWNNLGVYDKNYVLDCDAIRLPIKTNKIHDRIKFLLLTVWKGLVLNAKNGFDCILAVYPDEFDLFGAYVLRHLTRKPLIVYMHDLYSEVRRKAKAYNIWKSIEEKVLSSASAVLVTNEIFEKHYVKRRIKNVAVLSSCVDLNTNNLHVTSQKEEHTSRRKLRVVYTGSVYAANEDTILSFLEASKKINDVEIIFATPYKKDYLRELSVGFLSKKKCQELQRSADVLFLPLSFRSPYPDEIKCAFPCKALEYLAAGKPILAIVPKGSFMEEFVKKNDVGIVVNELSEKKIIEAIEMLKDEAKREIFSKNAKATIQMFDSKIQAKTLLSIINCAISDTSS